MEFSVEVKLQLLEMFGLDSSSLPRLDRLLERERSLYRANQGGFHLEIPNKEDLDIPPTCCHCGSGIELQEKIVWYDDTISAHMYPTVCITKLRKRIEELEEKKGEAYTTLQLFDE